MVGSDGSDGWLDGKCSVVIVSFLLNVPKNPPTHPLQKRRRPSGQDCEHFFRKIYVEIIYRIVHVVVVTAMKKFQLVNARTTNHIYNIP